MSKIIMFLCLMSSYFMAAQVISEICPSNQSNYEHDAEGYSDWIEIYNPYDSIVDLTNFSITNDKSNPDKWSFTYHIIHPNQHLVFIADESSNLNETINFNFPRTGGNVYLYSNQGLLIDSICYPSLAPNHSYGKSNGEYFVFTNPSPTFNNSNEIGYKDYAESPSISIVNSNHSRYLTLSTSQEGTTIYYTLNGSNPINGTIYSNPILIEQNMSIKAISHHNSLIKSPTVYKTIFLHQNHNLPVVNLMVDSSALFDKFNGLYMMGPNADSAIPFAGANFWSDREITAHYDYFDTDLNLRETRDCALKIHGGKGSRTRPMKPLELILHNYHDNNSFNYQYFQNKSSNKYSRLVLRNSGNDFGLTMMKDGMIHDYLSLHKLNLDLLGYHPIVLYINSQYWGIHNIREKLGKHYLHSNYNIDPETVNILENKNLNIVEGSDTGFINLSQFIVSNNMNIEANFKWVEERLDITSYIDYFIVELFTYNKDWPSNNLKVWNAKEQPKWRYFCYDLDVSLNYFWGINLPDKHYLKYMLVHKSETNIHIGMLKALLSNSKFKKDFINRYADLLNTVFKYQNINQFMQEKKAILEADIPRHFEKWPVSNSNWLTNLSYIDLFFQNRVSIVREELSHTFDTPKAVEINIMIYPRLAGKVKLNTITLTDFPFNGKYYPSNAIKLSAIPLNNHKFLYWENQRSSEISYESEQVVNPNESDDFIAVFSANDDPFNLSVFPNPAKEYTTIDYSIDQPTNIIIEIYRIDGKLVKSISNLSHHKKGVYKHELLLGDLGVGHYIILLKSEYGKSMRSIIKY